MPDEKQITNEDVLKDKIVIRKEYFENIQTAINSINEFFTSNFKRENFRFGLVYKSRRMFTIRNCYRNNLRER